MSARPWDKFYYSDWRADPALGMCSLAARGLWLEMLALMHEADPRGYLLINGNPPDETQLAALARCPSDHVPVLLAELEKAGVFNRRRDSVIYSRRQVRDEKRRKDGEKAAKSGTIPGSRRDRQASDKRQEKSPPTGVEDGVVDNTPPHPEARSQNIESKNPPLRPPKGEKARRTGLPEGFPDEACRVSATAYWSARGRHDLDFATEAEKFRASARANGRKYVDWPAAWQTWYANAIGFNKPQPAKRDGPMTDWDEVARRFEEREKGTIQ